LSDQSFDEGLGAQLCTLGCRSPDLLGGLEARVAHVDLCSQLVGLKTANSCEILELLLRDGRLPLLEEVQGTCLLPVHGHVAQLVCEWLNVLFIIEVICVDRSMANEVGCASDIATLRWSRIGLGVLKVRSDTGQMVQWVERIRGIGGVSHGKGEER